ncbi:hypothetical protein EJP82_26985 [Paenibacillus anaericanus]|uniref:DUF6199 domain-containing protein n=2 Tax=Paenibacillus anaericanus TaxID=170367 RepID=A0A433XVT5_9BACL|nr:hypothetical protein EJP82_26985 [Paenibacillus anaericanus]
MIFVFMTPLLGVLIWTYFCPEESLLWGKRWMYKEEPELSEGAIRYTKIASLIAIVVLTIIFGALVFSLFAD